MYVSSLHILPASSAPPGKDLHTHGLYFLPYDTSLHPGSFPLFSTEALNMVCPRASKVVLVPDSWKNKCKRKPLLASGLELELWTGKSKGWVKEACDVLLPTYAHSCLALRHMQSTYS